MLALHAEERSSPGTSWRSRWSARGAARLTGRGWRSGSRAPWPEPVSRWSPGWPEASTPRPTAVHSAPGGRSIAVLANGLSSIYPPEHEDLARALAESGAVVSEMPMRQIPLARALHPAEPDHLRDRARGRGGRSHAAQRVAFDCASCHGAEPRGLRGARAGRQPLEPRLPSA